VDWLILALIVGAVLPLLVAAGVLFFAATRGLPVDWQLTLAFGKGLGLGAAAGLTVSALAVGAALAVRVLAGR